MKHEGVRERVISIPRGTHFQVSSRSEKVWKEGARSNRKGSQFASVSHYCVRRQAESRRGGGRNGKWAVRVRQDRQVGLDFGEKLGDADGMFGRLASAFQ